MAPGPASSGIPSGTTPISARLAVPAVPTRPRWSGEPDSFARPISRSAIPPPTHTQAVETAPEEAQHGVAHNGGGPQRDEDGQDGNPHDPRPHRSILSPRETHVDGDRRDRREDHEEGDGESIVLHPGAHTSPVRYLSELIRRGGHSRVRAAIPGSAQATERPGGTPDNLRR
jgi:hypothetical protein